MRTGVVGFKKARHQFVPVACLLLAACAGSPAPRATTAAPPRMAPRLARLQPPPTPAAAAMADAMSGDFALARSDLAAAAQAYARAADASDNPELAARATVMAIAVRDGALARTAMARWQALGAKPLDLDEARASLALAEDERADAMEAVAKLAGHGAQGWQAALRVLASARNRTLAGDVLVQVAVPPRLPVDDAAVWLACSELGQRLGRGDYALSLAQQLLARGGPPAAYLWLAQLQVGAGRQAAAEATLGAGLRQHPGDPGLRMARATQLADAGQTGTALRLLVRGPQTPATYALRAAVAVRGNDRAALQALYAALSRLPAPQRAGEAYLLGQLAEVLQRPRDAMQWYADVPDEDEHSFAADIRRAVLLDRTGHPAQARALADSLAEEAFEDPDHYREATILQAELAMHARDYARAVDAYNRALLFQPHDWALVYARGVAAAEDGRTDAAVRDFRAVLAAQPDNVDAMNALGYTLADAGRDLPEARLLLQRALAARPDDAAINDSWGWLQYRLGDYAGAVRALRKAWRLQASAEIGAHLAHALLASGERAQARRILDQARRLDPHSRSVQALRGKTGS